MTKSGIYIIQNLISGKVYIGSAVDIKARWGEHLSSLKKGSHGNSHLQRAWNRYGSKAFEFKALLYCELDVLIHHEQLMIDEYRKNLGRDMLYNINPTAGSNLGVKFSPETRAKKSAALKGKKRITRTEKRG